MNKFTRRSLIVLFWVALIFGTLYLPNLKTLKFEENQLNVFAWGDILDPNVVGEIEKETGIKVNLSYYSSNEELLVKMRATGGEGYDLILPSDFAVSLLASQGLLKPIDKSKLDFWNELNPLLLNHDYDRGNHYSIPFEWEMYGFGVDSNYFKDHPLDRTWGLIFKDHGFKIAMINEPMQAVIFADQYLYGSLEDLNPEKLEEVKALLTVQKNWTEVYADFRGDYFLATGGCPVAVASTSYIWRTIQLFPFVNFVIPEDGSFITIENVCIVANSDKEELAYRFINALFKPDSLIQHLETFGTFPARTLEGKLDKLDPKLRHFMQAAQKNIRSYKFYRRVATEQEVRDLWVDVKS